MKTLYMDARRGLDVALDGPSLRVRRPGRADGHYPLPRVARVVTVGAVRWHPGALTACLREHKPIAVLDAQGRFVRVLFHTPAAQYGMARHLGELLRVPRFRERYERWYGTAERSEMLAAMQQLDLCCQDLQPNNVWQRICFRQHRWWRIRVGGCYRYLLGLAAAQIASAYSRIGLPRAPMWERQEYRLFRDTIRLERWRLAVILEQVLARCAGQPERRELTAAFEGASDERERRIAAWRQRILLEMMGVRSGEEELSASEKPDRKQPALVAMFPPVALLCRTADNGAGNLGHVAIGTRGSFRSSARILRAYLEYDRRMLELYRTA